MTHAQTSEAATITVTRYRLDGRPTCGSDWSAGRVCVFAGCRKFGTVPVCGALLTDCDAYSDGVTKPLSNCPIWLEKRLRAQGESK